MPRIRTVKPEFWLNEELAELPPETRLLAIGLLNQSDDGGYFKASPAILKGAVFPFNDTSVSIHTMLMQLSQIKYISLHTGLDGKSYGYVINFLKHQVINRPTKSKIKDLVDITENSVSIHTQFTDDSLQERKGKEQGKEQGRGKENNSRSHSLAWFEILWNSFDPSFGEKGSKKNAQAQFNRINPDQQLFDLILASAERQLSVKRMQDANGSFFAPFQHVERWLKNRRWEDEISSRIVKQRDTRDKAAIAADQAFGSDFDDSVFEGSFTGAFEDGIVEQPDTRGLPNMGARLVRPE